MRGYQCARVHAHDFFYIIDTLTSASLLPGVDVIIEDLPTRVVGTDHGRVNDMSKPHFVVFRQWIRS